MSSIKESRVYPPHFVPFYNGMCKVICTPHRHTLHTSHSGLETKNHSRENYRSIRQIQEKRKQREEKAAKPVKPVYIKSDKYNYVQPKVTLHAGMREILLLCHIKSSLLIIP